MKSNVYRGLFFCLCVPYARASHTFFSVPVPFQPASVERQTMVHNQLRDYTIEKWHDFSVTLFGGGSTDSSKLARYFLPFNKNQLTAAGLGSAAVQNGQADLIAHYFNVLTGLPRTDASSGAARDNIFPIIDTWKFESTLSFAPSHKFFGLGLLYHQHVSSDLDHGWWLEFAMPIMNVKNTMGMCECIITPTGVCTNNVAQVASFFSKDANEHAQQSMTAAFASYVMRFGRIDACQERQSKWGVADLEAQIGYTFWREPYYHLHAYGGVLVPTGNTPDAQYLFEKIIGNNGHLGFFAGLAGGLKAWEHDENFLALEVNAALTLFLDKTQLRSFDFQGKPWGRYIWAYPNNANIAQLSPGINFFTKSVRVSHGSLNDFNIAGVYTLSHFQGELGYHCYARAQEGINLARCWVEGPGLAAIWYSNNNFITTGARATRSSATINNYTTVTNDIKEFKAIIDPDEQKNNDAYRSVTAQQLDLASAAHPAIIVNTLYLSLGYAWYDARVPVLINIAGAYDFGNGTAVMNSWKIWGKFGISF